MEEPAQEAEDSEEVLPGEPSGDELDMVEPSQAEPQESEPNEAEVSDQRTLTSCVERLGMLIPLSVHT